jgi:class 3 adenylate cyclase/tetratricopeptide (TPR) repeat protein
VTDVAAWLRGLGLGRYEAAFRDNDIGADVLRELTADDLREIGVASVGDRRRLLAAIAALRGPAPSSRTSADEAPPPAQAAAPTGAAPPRDAEPHRGADGRGAERRQLTVLFCDLVGSTALASRLDPEDLREVIAAYHGRAAALIRGGGGFVAKYVGDGVLAYFGYPQAREEDAECAVRAGLAVAQAVEGLATPAGPSGALRARVGIASGLVVVGNGSDEGTGEAHAVVGDTPNLAARLQALAEPGTVVIDPATRRRIGGLFACEDLGPRELKGVPDGVRAWRVRAESQGRSRFEALRAEGLTALVGREEELDLLLRRWRQARAGEGRVVLVAGEPGIGKSRLADALEARLRGGGEAFSRLHYYCAPHRRDSAFHPVIAQLERAAAFAREDGPGERLRKLRAFLAASGAPDEDLAPLAGLLSIPAADGGLPGPELSPQRRREAVLEALVRQVEAAARRAPVLLLVEDAHWLDPSSRELLDLLVERAAGLPLLAVVTHRPEFQPPWLGRAGVSVLVLSRLDRGQAAEVAGRVAARAALPGELLERIVAEADGVPLFIEELTKAVLESPAGPGGGGAGRLSVPSTLQASLMARLDRLPAAKEVAQAGAVIGRAFPHALAAAVARLPEPALLRGLEELVGAGLASRRGEPPEATYTFKHALVQDTAYESLLRGRRAALHARAVEALLAQDPALEEAQPEVLGHHCAEAKLVERAAGYYLKAGQRSAERSAMAEARAHLSRGLALAAEMPDGPARQLRRAELQLALGSVEMATHGYGSPEHGSAFAAATELCRALPPAEPRRARFTARALYGDWSDKLHRGDLAGALAVGEDLYRLGHDQRDPDVRLLAAAIYGQSCFLVGRLAEAMSVLAEALRSSGPGGGCDPGGVDFGIDAEILFLGQFSRALACTGHPDQARSQAELGLERARRLNHLPSRAIALAITATTFWILRDVCSLRRASDALVAISGEQGFAFWLARGKGYAGWTAAQDGDAERGRTLIEEALSGLRAAGIGVYGPHTRAMLADACALGGRGEAALGAVEEGLGIMARTGEVWLGADLHRRKGELLLAGGGPRRDTDAAEASFRRAVALARGQSAKLLELRAATGLARLWSGQGRRAEARGLLAPVYASFTEGFSFPDLVEARALLEELGAAPARGRDRPRDEARTPRDPDRLREPAPGR